MNHTLISPISYVDVSAVYVCAIPLEMVCLLCVGSVVYWSVWVLTTFSVWRAGVGVWGVGRGGFYGRWVFRRVSKILLGNVEWLSFRWSLATYSAWK